MSELQDNTGSDHIAHSLIGPEFLLKLIPHLHHWKEYIRSSHYVRKTRYYLTDPNSTPELVDNHFFSFHFNLPPDFL
jgi:hypothetical protein